MLEISDNESVGIFVADDGYDSEAQIDSRNILFHNVPRAIPWATSSMLYRNDVTVM